MKISVRYYGRISHIAGHFKDEFELENGTTLQTLTDLVVKRYGQEIIKWCFPRDRDKVAWISINRLDINDKKIFPDWIDTKLQEGDVVAYIGPVSGPA